MKVINDFVKNPVVPKGKYPFGSGAGKKILKSRFISEILGLNFGIYFWQNFYG
jgi:hypothetical protein